ncbi:MAG TPA: CHAP domain-containing protein [Clostridiaceae bacterium]|nr:CHAP domain-containing protein [Clostridiaceae bacterium]
MADIKTKTKSTIKTLDKTRAGIQKIKDNLIEVKEKTDNINDSQYDSAEEYATQNIKNKAEIMANKILNGFDKQGRKSFVNTKNTIQNEIEKYKVRQEEKQQIKNNIAKTNEIKGLQGNETLQTNKNKQENIIDIKSKDKVVKVNSNKRALNKNMKQANNLSKKAIKAAEKVEKNAEILVKENIKTSQKIMQATKELTRKATQTTKKIVKATRRTIQAIVESSKFLINLIIAGGWISVIVILVVVVFGGTAAFIKVGTKSSTGDNSQINYEITSPILSVAKSQLGQKGGQPYWSWYGFNDRVAWCACFVSWCANQCGLIENGQIPRYSVCDNGIAYFKEKDRWQDRETGYLPVQGDIIFFNWLEKDENGNLYQDEKSDHTGIVEYYDSSTNKVYTIEGNSGDECKERSYNADDIQIMGYGTMDANLDTPIKNINGSYEVDQAKIEEELQRIKDQDLQPIE